MQNDADPSREERRHVLDQHRPRLELLDHAEHLKPQPRPLPVEARAAARVGQILAGESARDKLDASELVPGLAVDQTDVADDRDTRAASADQALAGRLVLDEADGLDPSRLKAEVET